MTVKDIQKVIFENVCLYTETSNFDYVEIFKGKAVDVPVELFDKRVCSVYATRKHMLDIMIEM